MKTGLSRRGRAVVRVPGGIVRVRERIDGETMAKGCVLMRCVEKGMEEDERGRRKGRG
jgi:hypothetical protein